MWNRSKLVVILNYIALIRHDPGLIRIIELLQSNPFISAYLK